MGHTMRIELTRAGLLVYVANHYTTPGAQGRYRWAMYWEGYFWNLIDWIKTKKKKKKKEDEQFTAY